ncbi:MAG: alpha/beta hydrolase [Olegusella sp.]|nr:alpha/beta hydrolase [Olegusella sp.]
MREFTVESTGVALHCRMYGEDNDCGVQTLLLIHGAMVDSDFFSYAAELLARRYRVVTYDRRGYGGTGAPADGAYEIDAQADDAAAVIRAVGGPCLVVGHSAGAIVAMALVARHPGLVSACILDEPPLKELAVPTDPAIVNLDLATEAIAAGRYAHAKVLFVDIMSRHDDRALPRTEAELAHLNDYFNHFIRHEFVSVFAYHPDYEALSRAKIALMLGDQSLDTYIAGIVEALSRRIGAPVFYRPGAHNGARDLPADYARTVVGAFELGW